MPRKKILASVAALATTLLLAVPAGATHESFSYDPPPENGTTSYDAPSVNVPFSVDPDPICVDPPAETLVVAGDTVTVDPPERCVDPTTINGTVSYDAASVSVPYTHDPAPRNVNIPHGDPPPPPPPPPPTETLYPRAAHIWGGNSQTAMQDKDIVIASSVSEADPIAARVNNPTLLAFAAIALDPFNSDWRLRRSSALTYGAGFRGGSVSGGPVMPPWPGVNDTLSPSPVGQIKGFNASTDDSCIAQNSMHFDLSNPPTAEMIEGAAWHAYKNGDFASRGWNGIWSDNLFPGNLLAAGWAFGSCAAGISKADWDTGLNNIAQGLRDFGVPFVGGNTVYRSNNPSVRASTNLAMNETLEAQISQGASAYATFLTEAMTWQNTGTGPKHLVVMHQIPSSDTAGMKFGLALTTIAGGAYLPYQSHSDLYMPAEMKKNGQRHYLGEPTGDPVRVGNTWSRNFQFGTVTANYDNKTVTGLG